MTNDEGRQVLTLPVRNVFALQVREQGDTLVARIVGLHDDDEVPESHVPPLPEVVEALCAPYRRPAAAPRRTG